MDTRRVIEIGGHLRFRMSPNDGLWCLNYKEDNWYHLSPPGEFWSDPKYGHCLPNEIMHQLNWPEVKFEVRERQWKVAA